MLNHDDKEKRPQEQRVIENPPRRESLGVVEPVPLIPERSDSLSDNEPPRSRVWHGMGVLWEVVQGLIEGGRLVQHVGPNDRPLERWEFEKPEHVQRRELYRY